MDSIRGFNRGGGGILGGDQEEGKDRVCSMEPDVVHVMWPVAGMGTAGAGCAMQPGKD